MNDLGKNLGTLAPWLSVLTAAIIIMGLYHVLPPRPQFGIVAVLAAVTAAAYYFEHQYRIGAPLFPGVSLVCAAIWSATAVLNFLSFITFRG